MSKTLILYASQKGSTAEVAQRLAAILQDSGHDVTLANAEGFTDDIHRYDAIILGTGIYKGMWLHPLLNAVRRLLPQFQQKPVWGFALCVRVLEPAGEDYARQFYLPRNLLDNLNVQDYQFFAGRLSNLTVSEKNILAERYDGHYHREHEGDNRDWDEIRAWGKHIAQKLEKVKA
jgi:menaquinone-dependent protoporphyrinogen oxidase